MYDGDVYEPRRGQQDRLKGNKLWYVPKLKCKAPKCQLLPSQLIT